MRNICDRLSKCYYDMDEEKYERLIFPRNMRQNDYVYDGEINYSHSPIYQDKNYMEYYTEMKDKYKEPYFFSANGQGVRKNSLKKFYWTHSMNSAYADLASPPKTEKYDTEYSSNFSDTHSGNKMLNRPTLIKYPLFEGRSDITTYYSYDIPYNRRNVLDPFKKTCYFTKPLDERMENFYEL